MNKVCKQCKKKITEPTYGLLRGKAYHIEEFLCFICKKTLENIEAFEDEESGNIYCGDCHHDQLAKKCDACQVTLIGTVVEAFGRYYHPHHFTCFKCKKLLEGNYYKNEERPVCQECFESRKKGNLR